MSPVTQKPTGGGLVVGPTPLSATTVPTDAEQSTRLAQPSAVLPRSGDSSSGPVDSFRRGGSQTPSSGPVQGRDAGRPAESTVLRVPATTRALRETNTTIKNPSLLDRAIGLLGGIAPCLRLLPEIRELDVSQLSDAQRIDLLLNLPAGATTAVRLRTKRYEANDPFVSDDALRAATTVGMTQRDRPPAWISVEGVLEIGSGQNGTLPLGTFGTADSGFDGKTLLRYRSVLPSSADGILTASSTTLPLDPTLVRGLLPGSEFELVGTGRAKAYGHGNGNVGTAGSYVRATAKAGLSIRFEGDVSLHVRKLDAQGRVRVVLERATSSTAELTSALSVGSGATSPNMPKLGEGALRAALGTTDGEPVSQLLSRFKASGELAFSSEASDRVLAAYDIDLATTEGVRAYEGFLGLSSAVADSLCAERHPAVSAVSLREHETTKGSRGGLNLLGRELLGFIVRTTERGGQLRNTHGDDLIYRETKYKKEWRDIFRGKRSIVWQAVTVPESVPEVGGHYFNMRFAGHYNRLSHDDVRAFARFGELLGVELADTMGLGAAHRSADVEIDVYFTENGIARIRSVDAKRARTAFLKAAYEINCAAAGTRRLCELNPQALATIDQILDAHDRSHGRSYADLALAESEKASLDRRYRAITGRSLVADAPTLRRARTFAAHVGRLNGSTDEASLRKFFASLGKAHGFEYITCIAALAGLAGNDETWVNNLSIVGDTVHIRSVSQGSIEHPEEVLQQMWKQATEAR